METTGLGILSDDLPDISDAAIVEERFSRNFNRWFGPQSSGPEVVVGFAGVEGIYYVADTPPTVDPHWANMMP